MSADTKSARDPATVKDGRPGERGYDGQHQSVQCASAERASTIEYDGQGQAETGDGPGDSLAAEEGDAACSQAVAVNGVPPLRQGAGAEDSVGFGPVTDNCSRNPTQHSDDNPQGPSQAGLIDAGCEE